MFGHVFGGSVTESDALAHVPQSNHKYHMSHIPFIIFANTCVCVRAHVRACGRVLYAHRHKNNDSVFERVMYVQSHAQRQRFCL